MILKKLTLNNIRSYESAEIDFPTGSVLLSGDIGAGKTTILLAIEFALFGLQPGQKGASLLRTGEKEGSVILEIEISGKPIIIERTLKKEKTISQDFASITIDGERKETSVSELKNKILHLLNYPSEFAKKTNLLYRFTVYTPQEEMKQIILETADTRLNTLRHVFGIDKYKRIKENAEAIAMKLREDSRVKQALILDLDEKKTRRESKLAEIEKLNQSVLLLDKELLILIEKRKDAEKDLEEIQGKIEEKKKYENEIEKTRVLVTGKNEMLFSISRDEERIKRQIEESKNISFSEADLTTAEKEKLEVIKNFDILQKKSFEILSDISSLNLKSSDSLKLREKISSMRMCPTCLQNVDAVYKANISNRADSEISENKHKIQEFSDSRDRITLQLDKLKKRQKELEEKISEMRLAKVRMESVKEKLSALEDIGKKIVLLKKDVEMLEKHVENLKEVKLSLSKYDSIYLEKNKALDLARRNEKIAEINLAQTRKEIEMTKKVIEELKNEIEKKEDIKRDLKYILELEDWLSNAFLEVVSFTEKNVMLTLRNEFSKLFNEWFNILVPDVFTVHLDEEFTPVIVQQDYEMDYDFLSGGERTAIALAYRLALNQTINSLLSKIKTREIVILDEPTDGFSEQQLDKMRDVLAQLKVSQLIIVSHESKIESFVEKIIKLRKDEGSSSIEKKG